MRSNRKPNRSKEVGRTYGFDQVSLHAHLPATFCTRDLVARGQQVYLRHRWANEKQALIDRTTALVGVPSVRPAETPPTAVAVSEYTSSNHLIRIIVPPGHYRRE